MSAPRLDESFRSGMHHALVDYAHASAPRPRAELFLAAGVGLAVAGAGAVLISGTLATPAGVPVPVPSVTAQQQGGDSTRGPGEEAARVRIYQNLQEVTEDSTIVIVGIATNAQRVQDDYPGELTLTEVTVTEVLKGDVQVGSTITLGDFGRPGNPPPTETMEFNPVVVSPGETYLLHLHSLDQYGRRDAPDQLVDASWIFVSPFPSHYELNGDSFVLTNAFIDDDLPPAIPLADVATLGIGLDQGSDLPYPDR